MEGSTESITGHRALSQGALRLMDALMDCVVAADEMNRIAYLNPAAESLLGWSRAEVIGEPLTILMPERFRERHLAGFRRYLETGEARIIGKAIHVPALTRSGREVDVDLSISVLSSAGEPPLFVATLRDLTEQVELERQVRVGRYLRAVVTSTSEMTAGQSRDRVLEVVVSTLVKDLDAALARVWLRDPATGAMDAMARAGTAGEPVDRRVLEGVVTAGESLIQSDVGDDSRFAQTWVSENGIRSAALLPLCHDKDELGVLEYYSRLDLPDEVVDALTMYATVLTTTLHDIGLLERTEVARTEAEAVRTRLEAIETITEGVLSHLSLDDLLPELLTRLRDILASDEATILLLRAEGELEVRASIGLEEEMTHRVRIPFGRGVAGTVAASQEALIVPDLRKVEAMSPWLREIYRSLVAVPLIVEGRTVGVLHVGSETLRDYTSEDAQLLRLVGDRAALAIERARLYEEQQAALAAAREAVRAREQFTTSMSHDLRNPLTTILAQAQLLQRRLERLSGPDIERVRRGLDSIAQAGGTLNRLITDLVEAARHGTDPSARRTLTDLVERARTVVAEYQNTAETHTITLHVQVPEILGIWDPDQIERILANLLSNACKYSPEGGPIDVWIEEEEAAGRTWVLVRVQDRGIGIPLDDLPRVFEPFHRGSNVAGKIEGSGIGLSGVKGMVEAHGGNVAVQSREGAGAVFTVRLPVDGAAPGRERT